LGLTWRGLSPVNILAIPSFSTRGVSRSFIILLFLLDGLKRR
jgi:hypothetical protein